MTNLKNVLNLLESKDGNRIKQGDKSIMQYVLSDTDKDELNLNGKQAIVYLSDRTGVRYKYDTTVQDNTVDVVIRAILPKGVYTLEIVVDDKYIFPSDNKAKIEIVESVVGRALTTVESVDMLDKVVSETLKSDKFTNAVQDEANKIVTLDKYKTLGQIYATTTTNSYVKDDHGNPIKALLIYPKKQMIDKLFETGNIYTNPSTDQDLKQALDNYFGVLAINYPPISDNGGAVPNNFDLQDFIRHLLKTNALPKPFAFRITRKVNNAVVATKDCDSIADLTFGDVELYTKEETGATLEVQYRYRDEVINDGMLVKDLTPKAE